MSISSHRESADAARAAAAATDLPNVRDRHLRSAAIHDTMAEVEERTAANAKLRGIATAARATAAKGEEASVD